MALKTQPETAAAEGEAVVLGLYYYDELPAGTRPPPQGWD